MRIPFIQLLFVILLALGLTSCVTTRQTNYLQPQKTFNHHYEDSLLYDEYRLKEDDRLSVIIYSTDSKTNAMLNGGGFGGGGGNIMSGLGSNEGSDLYTYLVHADGNIQFPFIGNVQVVGKTLRESKYILQDALKPILKISSVDIRMVSKSFSVIGSGKAGRISFPKEKVNIYQALALAGDFGVFTDRSKIRILRKTEKGTSIRTFDIRGEDIINSEFYYLEPDDVIFLQPMKAQFFGVTTFWAAVSTLITTMSFGAGIYSLITK